MQGEGVTRMCSTLLSRGLSLNSHEPTRAHKHTQTYPKLMQITTPESWWTDLCILYAELLRIQWENTERGVCVCGCTRAVSERIDGVRNVKNLQTLWYVFVCVQRTEFWYDSIYWYSETSIV